MLVVRVSKTKSGENGFRTTVVEACYDMDDIHRAGPYVLAEMTRSAAIVSSATNK